MRYFSEVGSHMRPTYGYKMVSGKKTLVKTGETDFYETIQQGAEDCTVKALIKRATLGDSSALTSNVNFGDLTKFPKDLASYNEMLLQSQLNFNQLPKEIKELFDNSYTLFMDEVLNGKADDKIKNFSKVEETSAESSNSVVNNDDIKGVNYDK